MNFLNSQVLVTIVQNYFYSDFFSLLNERKMPSDIKWISAKLEKLHAFFDTASVYLTFDLSNCNAEKKP